MFGLRQWRRFQEEAITDVNELCSRVPDQGVQEHLYHENRVGNRQEDGGTVLND